jgi:hypothetical protein
MQLMIVQEIAHTRHWMFRAVGVQEKRKERQINYKVIDFFLPRLFYYCYLKNNRKIIIVGNQESKIPTGHNALLSSSFEHSDDESNGNNSINPRKRAPSNTEIIDRAGKWLVFKT